MSRREIKTVDWNNLLSQKEFWFAFFDENYSAREFFAELYSDPDNDTEYTLSNLILSFPNDFTLLFSSYLTPYYVDVLLQQHDVGELLDIFREEEAYAILQCLQKQSSDNLPVKFEYIALLLRRFTVPTKSTKETFLKNTAELAYNTGIFSQQESEELALKHSHVEVPSTWEYNEEVGWVQKTHDGYYFRWYPPSEGEEDDYNFDLVREFMRTVHKCAGIEDALV